MFLKNIDLTTALRPAYLPDEVLLFVQDNVGLYEGKYKIPDHQNGQVYLTSHRICYVDNADPRKHSTAIDLKDVDRFEFYAGFLKSSSKITLFPKPPKRTPIQNRVISNLSTPSRSATSSPLSRAETPFHLPPPEPSPASIATWICPICAFSNPVPSHFDPTTANERTPLTPCSTCGVKPPYSLVLKAAISSATNRAPPSGPATINSPIPVRGRATTDTARPQSDIWPNLQNDSRQSAQPKDNISASFPCPRCTFLNHPSLRNCELCGALLVSPDLPSGLNTPLEVREESPGPSLTTFPPPSSLTTTSDPATTTIKLSFRGGGEKLFLERLKSACTQRQWLTQYAPPAPNSSEVTSVAGSRAKTPPPLVKTAGIAGLEQRRMEVRKNNELAIGTAFEDLESLMASAKEIIALAESFAASNPNNANGTSETNAVASALGLVTTKDMLGGGSNSESLYISELSRNLAEFLTDDARGVLKKAGGIISLVDLWAMFNRSRNGIELVSPLDFEKAARLWEKLRLPVRLREFGSGVLVVQGSDRTDDKTIKSLQAWLADLHRTTGGSERGVTWDVQMWGRGVTAQDAAEKFGWSIGVAEEELRMCEEKGVVCREEGIEGVRFWENWIVDGEEGDWEVFKVGGKMKTPPEQEMMIKALKEAGFL